MKGKKKRVIMEKAKKNKVRNAENIMEHKKRIKKRKQAGKPNTNPMSERKGKRGKYNVKG